MTRVMSIRAMWRIGRQRPPLIRDRRGRGRVAPRGRLEGPAPIADTAKAAAPRAGAMMEA